MATKPPSLLRRLVRAIPHGIMLGVGTLLQPKTRPDDHWSTPPTIQVVDEQEDSESGAPPRPPGR